MSSTIDFPVNSTEIPKERGTVGWDVSEYVDHLTFLLVYKIFGMVLSVLGIFGNICTIAVLGPKKDKRKITIFIMALAMSDLVALFTFLFFCFYWVLEDMFDPYEHIDILRKNYYFITYIMRVPKSTTSTLTVVIAIERLISIANAKASLSSSFKSNKIAIIVSVAIAIAACILFLPFALEFTYKTVYNKKLDRYISNTIFTSFGKHRDFFFVYYILINVVCTILSVVTTLICNVALIIFLMKRSKLTIGSTSSNVLNKREISTTKTLLFITFVFVFCSTPAAIYYPLKALNVFGRNTYLNRVLFAWINFLELVNHFANPPLFYFTSLEFRRAYQNLFRKNVVEPSEASGNRNPTAPF